MDCVLLVPEEIAFDPGIDEEFEKGLPFLQVQVVGVFEFTRLAEQYFASDRRMVPKGVVEVIL